MKAFAQKARELRRDEEGQTIVLAALCMTLLLGFVALSVDVGLMFHAKRAMQTAADSGAIAGALETNYGDVTAAAQKDAALNGFTDGTGGVTVAVNNPPLSGAFAGNHAYVEVIVSSAQATYFMRVFNVSSAIVRARSVATLGQTQNCVYTLNPSGTDISITNGATVQMSECALYGASSSSSALLMNGNGVLNAGGVNLVGGYSITNGASSTVTPTTGIAPISDPLGFLPKPTFNAGSCLADPNYGYGPHSVSAGGGTVCYNGFHTAGGGTETFASGLYIINGAFSVQGGSTISGTGVTFYLPPGASFYLSNGSIFNFTAPTSGAYNGVLFYQDRANSNAATFQGGATSTMQGILYFPDANVTLDNGTGTSWASVVAGSLTFAGGATVKNYADVNASNPLSSARLVE